MRFEEISKFLNSKVTNKNKYVKIEFNKRPAIYGFFIALDDFSYLSSKNFWRVVTKNKFDEYAHSKNNDLARIFNGSEFSRLSLLRDEF